MENTSSTTPTPPEVINLSDPEALAKQIKKLRPEKCEAEVNAILEKYQCTLIYQEIKQNGRVVHFEICAVPVEDLNGNH